jgi:flagellar protein FliJ
MFKFKLQSVLNVRLYNEKTEKQNLSQLFTERNNLISEMELKARQIKGFSENQAGAHESKNVREKLVQEFLLSQLKEIWELEKTLRIKNSQIEQQREKLIEANKEVQILEKLKQKALVEHLREEERKDQNFQNEVATQMFYKPQEEWI